MGMRLDDDCSGALTLDEVLCISEEDLREINDLLPGEMDTQELFEILDHDMSGSIQIDEFLDGLYKISISENPIYITQLKKQVSELRVQMTKNMSNNSTAQAAVMTVLQEF